MTRIDLQKFYQDLNEKLITAICTLDNFAWKVNLSKN